MITAESYWFFFATSFANCYSIAVLVLVILYLLKKKWRNEVVNWLYVFNTIIASVSLINLLLFLSQLFVAWYGQNPYQWYTFKENRININSPYGWSYWLLFATGYLLPQLFWIRKLSMHVLLTLLFSLWIGAGIWYERFVIFITSMYRDYLPSAWSTYRSGPLELLTKGLAEWICVLIIAGFIYWRLNKRKKLPFESALLSYSLFFISYSLLLCIHLFNYQKNTCTITLLPVMAKGMAYTLPLYLILSTMY